MATSTPLLEGPDRHGARRRTRRREQPGRHRHAVVLAAAAIVIALALLVGVRLLIATPPTLADGPVPQETLAAIRGVPVSTFEEVGRGTAQSLPTPIRAGVRRGPNGLPLVTYIGAEYCPFCAAERWAIVVALSRFGQFSGLQMSHSASDDVYPNTPTFSFVGASYQSPYLEFSSVELQSNQRSGNSHAPLQTPTAEQQQLLRLYDVPPFVPANSAGAIPFLDLADQYIVSGSSFDVGVLRGQSVQSIAQTLSDPAPPTARAIVGSANTLTAALCPATAGNPPNVCGQPTIQALQPSLSSTAVPGRG
jgi:Domain of unknown function (DUF929)